MTTRVELYQRLGLLKVVQPVTKTAMKEQAQRKWEEGVGRSPHGHPWHTSFHASSFPGDSDRPCARKALYTLMDIPDPKPTDPDLSLIGDVGKAVERSYVQAWDDSGLLLSRPPDSPTQTGFAQPDLWLTGSTDAVILPPGWNRPHVVEVKSKDHEVIDAMHRGDREWDESHRLQCLVYIYLAHQATPFLWPKLDPCTTGSILYVSRQRPGFTYEFYFDLDQDVIDQGLSLIAEWKEAFVNDILPERPAEWRWTEEPCKYCKFKNAKLSDGTAVGCKVDDKLNQQTLTKSSLVRLAQDLNPCYDPEMIREEVFKRWRRR